MNLYNEKIEDVGVYYLQSSDASVDVLHPL